MPPKQKTNAKKEKPAPKDEPKKIGRPTKRTDEVIQRIIEGLSIGTPLTIICKPDDMPSITSVWQWKKDDPALSESIACAREAGFDAIAIKALDIADNIGTEDRDTIITERGGCIPNSEWIQRSKLRVETRLKLLAKWDPKRYGELIRQEHSGPDGSPIRTEDANLSPDQQKALDELIKGVQNRVKK